MDSIMVNYNVTLQPHPYPSTDGLYNGKFQCNLTTSPYLDTDGLYNGKL